jgi:lysozyme family protein
LDKYAIREKDMYSDAFEAAINHAMLYEVGGFWKMTPDVEAGLISTPQQRKAVGYVNDPDDSGGETKFGVAKNANLDLNITDLTWAQAKAVYYKRYWLLGSCDKLSPRTGILHLDGCINHGVGRASKFLQKALLVEEDGKIGPATLEKATNADQIVLCNAICDNREQFYRDIAANKPTQEKFLAGWLRRIKEMRVFTTDPESFN